MKTNKKLFTSMIMTLCFIVLLTACGTSNNNGNSTLTNSSGTVSTSTNSSDEVKSTSPVKLKIYVQSNVADFPNGENVNNNLIYEFINEATGYDIEWEIQPKENVDQKINIMMASGETPDLIMTQSKGIFTNLAQQNLLTPVNDLVNQHGPNIVSEVTDDAWSAVTFNEQRYAVPVPQNQVSTSGFAVRKDWLDQLNMPEPRTVDDYYEVMKALKVLDPAGNGKTIPLTGGAADGNGNAFGYLGTFAGAYGLNSEYIVEGDEVIHTYTHAKAKEYLIFMNKLYKEGLLDQEYPINKQANVFEKMVAGQAAMSTISWVDKSVFESLHERDPQAELVHLQPPVGPYGDWGFVKHQPIRTYLMIPRFSDKAAEVIDFINKYMEQEVMDTVSYGFEGVHHKVSEDGYIDNLPEMDNIAYRIYYRLWDTSKDFNNRLRLGGFLPYYEPIMEHARVTNILNFAPPLDIYETHVKELSDLTNEYFVKIITGALPIDSFDEYTNKWKNSGGTESLKEINEWYATFK